MPPALFPTKALGPSVYFHLNRSRRSTMHRSVCAILSFMLCSQSAIAYNSKFVPDVSRRDWMKKGIIAVAAGMTLNSPESANANKYCAFGTGDGCEDLAEGNEYIRELQARSAANKEAIQLEARNAYYMKNYPDWFATVGKSMVKKPDGTFMVVGDAELQDLKKQNKIGVEIPRAMGGKVSDLTQKPIMVLKE